MRDSESEKKKAADLIYKKIEVGTKNTKTKNVLKQIKEACDFYEGEHIPITMARVGKYWEQRGGGVHAQSIRNNPQFREYVLARATAVSVAGLVGPKRRKTPQEQGDEYIVLAEAERHKVVAETLKKVIEKGDFDLERALKTGELVPLTPQKAAPGHVDPVIEEALDVIERLMDGERLEHFGLHVEGERVVSLEGREFLSKRDYRRLRAALEQRGKHTKALPPVPPDGENQSKGKAMGELENRSGNES
ncbi:MAG TPA: hypothetical protein VEC99_00670 [Clostridia bacterium]|nr:hypothetical protein [Clostridia bacterium]